MRITWLAAAAVTLALGGTAQASSLYIDFAATPTGTVSYTGTSLGVASALNFGNTTWNVAQIAVGDQSGLAVGNPITITPQMLTIGTGTTFSGDLSKTWTTGSGTFSEAFTSGTIVRGTTSIDLELVGTLTPPTGPAQAAYLDISLNQAGGAHGIVFGAATNTSFSTAPGPVPGVGYAGLVALALAGLYTRARRA